MPVTDPTTVTTIDLSRAEQWVLHHVMLDTIETRNDHAGGGSLDPAIRVLEKLETGEFAFTRTELECIRRSCRTHAQTTEAAADRNLATAITDRIELALET